MDKNMKSRQQIPLVGKRVQSVGRRGIGTPPPLHDWKVGDRVSFAASPAPDNRSVYTGVIKAITGTIADVREDGYGATCGVGLHRLFLAGAYIVQPSGPRGVRYFDKCDLCKVQLTQADVDSNDREEVDALNVGFICLACQADAQNVADGIASLICTDPERERNHKLGSMAASCHTCAMQSRHGWEPGDACYVVMDGTRILGTVRSFDANGHAVVTVTVNGNTGDLHVPISLLEGTDLP